MIRKTLCSLVATLCSSSNCCCGDTLDPPHKDPRAVNIPTKSTLQFKLIFFGIDFTDWARMANDMPLCLFLIRLFVNDDRVSPVNVPAAIWLSSIMIFRIVINFFLLWRFFRVVNVMNLDKNHKSQAYYLAIQ